MYALLVVASQFAKAFVRQAPINDNRMRAPVTGAENRKPVIDLIAIQCSNCALLSTRFTCFLYLVILLFTYFLMRSYAEKRAGNWLMRWNLKMTSFAHFLHFWGPICFLCNLKNGFKHGKMC